MRHSIRTPALAVLALLAAGSGPAWAHAHLQSATPAPGSTVAAPDTVVISYTEGVEARFSSIEVQDAAGHRVDKGTLSTVPTDNKRLSIGLQPLQPGTYKVTWHVTSVDTHKTDGTFQFTVKPQG
ncbi:copper homeostasis periplasmic binding protein CopC [Roseomonas elaeocarpi]|uniref:Copper homeostasis periplasmic binding protein CopC n=1 Tax=Roseomonas elaeocarpi TaxID=907779 RepID=A0ABV6JPJ1_9PROT